jgi:hypothetical protein
MKIKITVWSQSKNNKIFWMKMDDVLKLQKNAATSKFHKNLPTGAMVPPLPYSLNTSLRLHICKNRLVQLAYNILLHLNIDRRS